MTDKEKELNEEQLKKAAGGHKSGGERGERDELSDAELGEASGAGDRSREGSEDRKESEEEN